MPTKKTSLGDAAQALAKKGFKVFPVAPGKKAPPLVKWKDAASSNPLVVRDMWTSYPAANIAIATGGGIGVVDLDIHNHDGVAEWKRLVKKLGIDSYTVFCRTPSGGIHLYYKVDFEIRNSASVLGPGIDVRGEGGYVIAPPSTTEAGEYTWGDCKEFKSFPVELVSLLGEGKKEAQAPLPEPKEYALPRGPARSTKALERYAEAAVRSEMATLSCAQPGTRNEALNRSAFNMGQLVAAPWAGLQMQTVFDDLVSVGLAIGLEEFEVMHTVESGFGSGMGSPRAEPEMAVVDAELDGKDHLHKGCLAFIFETPEVAEQVRVQRTDIVALAPTAKRWAESWTRALVASKPEKVVVWMRDGKFGSFVANNLLRGGIAATLKIDR